MNCISSANYENWANLQAVSKLHDTSYTDANNLVGFYGYCGLKKKKKFKFIKVQRLDSPKLLT